MPQGATRRKSAPPKGTPGRSPQRLTAQHELFVDALVDRNLNTKDAAIAAGVPPKSAASMGCQWLNSDKYPQIAYALEKKKELRRNTSDVDAKRILQELARIGLFNPKSILRPDGKGMLDLKDMPDDIAAVISNITVTFGEEQDDSGDFHRLKHIRFSFHDKLAALSQMCNMMGLNQGGAATVINNTNTVNQLIINFDDLYKKQAKLGQLPEHNDPIEAEIAALEAGNHTLANASAAIDTSSDDPKLKVVESNE